MLFSVNQLDCGGEGTTVGSEEANCGRPEMPGEELTVLNDQLTVKVKGEWRLKMTLFTQTSHSGSVYRNSKVTELKLHVKTYAIIILKCPNLPLLARAESPNCKFILRIEFAI